MFLQAAPLYLTFLLIFVLLALAVLVAFVLVAVWMARDCAQRGESAALWVTLFVVGGLFSGGLVALIILLVYVAVRSKEIKYDRNGNLLLPTAPPQPVPYGTPPPSGGTPGYVPRNPYTTQPYAQPMPRPGWSTPAPVPVAPIKLSRVKCPRCQNIFEYQKQPAGPTHVKCPNCGEEGNI